MSQFYLPTNQDKAIEKIKRKIAVLSGKGGVGKSTVSALIASQLSKKGYKVGLLDADITGASIPKIFGIKEKPTVENKKIIPPVSKNGIKIMSMNLLLEKEDQAIIWRGPLITKVLKQFLFDVKWEELDYLVIDLPPGTSDAPLTIMQTISLDGVIIVSSPQSLVNMIVKKAVNMVNSLKIPVLGLVDNMSYVICPHCHNKIELFGKSNAKEVAEENNIEFLGSLPLDPELARLCDKGNIEEFESKEIKEIVEKIENKLRKEDHKKEKQ